MTKIPVISVVLPVFNGEAFIRKSVESILSQTFTDFELIIINDGSTDNSSEILRKLSANDPRIILIERSNAGLVYSLNEGIEKARGEFIARMDADDIAMPERFELQLSKMIGDPNLAVLGSFTRIIDKEGSVVGLGRYPVTPAETEWFLQHGSPLAHPTVLMRKHVLLELGGYRKVFSHCEDYDLWLRINEMGWGIANLSKPLLNYRVHGANISAVHRDSQELGSVIARLSCRCRKAGLSDPVVDIEKIDITVVDKFPSYLRDDFDASIFVLRYSSISVSSLAELLIAWMDYKKQKITVKRHKIMSGFLMRLFNGALQKMKFSLALRVLFESIRYNPAESFIFLTSRLKSFFRF